MCFWNAQLRDHPVRTQKYFFLLHGLPDLTCFEFPLLLGLGGFPQLFYSHHHFLQRLLSQAAQKVIKVIVIGLEPDRFADSLRQRIWNITFALWRLDQNCVNEFIEGDFVFGVILEARPSVLHLNFVVLIVLVHLEQLKCYIDKQNGGYNHKLKGNFRYSFEEILLSTFSYFFFYLSLCF